MARYPAGINAARLVLVGVALLAGATAAGIGALALADALKATGLPDTGPLTSYGLPFVRAVGEIAAVTAVGAFMFAAFMVPPQKSGVLDVAGYRALRTGTVASCLWTVCAVLMVPLTISDVSGQPVLEHLNPVQLWSVVDLVNTASAWRWTAIIAAVVTVASLPVLRWGWTPMLFAGALLTLAPLGATGHSATGGDHDLATNSLMIHLVAAALWAGGLLALLAHALRSTDHADLAAHRFSRLALWCFLAIAVSGVINALVRIDVADLIGTEYGRLVLAKIGAFILLGLLGWQQRRRGVAAVQRDPHTRGPLIRLALSEAVIFGLTFGVAVGLGRTPPPPPPRQPSPTEVAVGFEVNGPPTVVRLLAEWRFDLLFGTAAIVLAMLYLAAVWRLRRRGDAWPAGRTVAWLVGCAVLLIATSSGLGRYMLLMFSMHMIAHLLLSMLVPILLALGGPLTLALRSLPAADRDAPPGPREWLLAALHSRVSRFFTHPIVATVMFVAGFYGLYFGGIFDTAVNYSWAQALMNIHFLLSGYLFFWGAIGVDPSPRQTSYPAKVGMVFATLPVHAFFGVVLMGTTNPLGERFYRSLQLGWEVDLTGDQRLGGAIAWAAGVVPLVVVLIALLIQWTRAARRRGQVAGRDNDADLDADNTALAEMAGREQHRTGASGDH